MKCLDTNFLVDVLRGKKEAENKLRELDEEGLQATTVVSVFELLIGARLSEKNKGNLKDVFRLISRLNVLTMTLESVDIASQIYARKTRKGKPIGLKDIFIAGIAISNGCDLVTRNVKHFSGLKKLRVETW